MSENTQQNRGIHGPFDDKLAGWQNDDLIFSQKQRDFLQEHCPDQLRVADWPELREMFKARDDEANRDKRDNRSLGFIALLFGCVALLSAAIVRGFSGLPDWLTATLLLVSAISGVVAVISGVTRALFRSPKHTWLARRLWTERLRQLNFQFIINNLDLAVKAVSDESKLAEWNESRAKQLSLLSHDFEQKVSQRVRNIVEDLDESDVWISPDWQDFKPPGASEASLAKWFEFLLHQRFEVQEDYSSRQLTGMKSPVFRHQLLSRVSAGLTVVLILFSLGVSALAFCLGLSKETFSDGLKDPWVVQLGLILGGLGIGFVALRAVGDGLQLQAESDRYLWYNAGVKNLMARYQAQETSKVEKLEILRAMERMSYQELRGFLQTNERAGFWV